MASEPSRPLLLPQNRKIRHLQGIYLRNLILSDPCHQSIDDAAQSVEQFQPLKPRRRSTVWSGASSEFRQKKLEDVRDMRMADTFFTLHCASQPEPIYISEVVEKTVNATFQLFDLSAHGPATTRLDTVTVKVWVKKGEFEPLLEQMIDLKSLQFIGKLEGHAFPPNCILFHLVDGIYTLDLTAKTSSPKPGPALSTSSYSALMRLSNLDDSIQDALATREELAAQINSILHAESFDEAPQAQEEAILAHRYLAAERKRLRASLRRRAELKASIEARRNAIKSGKHLQAQAMEDMENAHGKLTNCRNLLATASEDIHDQRRRICEELMEIYPIEPTTSTLIFTICGLRLPDPLYDDEDEEVIAAALGYVARIVDMLQYYLSVPLPYPISPYGSQSIIQDLISILQDNQRTFPLYKKGTVQFRFDYGVFLLNKNIERLSESQGLKVMDIRQTLPNLKYLLYICSAGSRELPARKAGGIRGLFPASRAPSRTHSRSRSRGESTLTKGEGVRRLTVRHLISDTYEDADVPSRPEFALSLRTTGLRENVGL